MVNIRSQHTLANDISILYRMAQYFKASIICLIIWVEKVAHLRLLSLEITPTTASILGSQELLMFEVNYIGWEEDVSSDKIKIHEGLYTESKPFASILCFCKVFQHLFWDNCIHETELTENEKKEVVAELKTILKTYYTDTTEC